MQTVYFLFSVSCFLFSVDRKKTVPAVYCSLLNKMHSIFVPVYLTLIELMSWKRSTDLFARV